jgi:hypothetical protein
VPNEIRVVVMMTLGYPAESPSARPRKKHEEIVAYDGWQDLECTEKCDIEILLGRCG